ncbi:MAG: AAA domain-containing protein [Aureliella sp.]
MQDDDVLEGEFTLARKPIRLSFPSAHCGILNDAREAVRREFREAVQWKRLRCRKVSVLSDSDTGTVYILDVGQSVEFDWTWEGAIAFRPVVLKEFDENPHSLFADDRGQDGNDDHDDIAATDAVVWSGEVLEVDETRGRIYICVSNPEDRPTTGSFYVRPFEFLTFLHAIFTEPAFEHYQRLLPSRLAATEGGLHPDADEYRPVGLPQLRTWWRKEWSILWGPPGTGKTFTTGQQVAGVLADPSERILVVSTTNRATDAAAIAIGRAAAECAADELARGRLLRIGKGASPKRFEEASLAAMLQGTEAEYLAQIEQLTVELAKSQHADQKALIRKDISEIRKVMRDAAQRNFLDGEIRVVVSTAFRATAFLKLEEVKGSIEAGFAPFTTVFIDEAGLVSRAAIAALSLLASRRVVLVGDSKQLAPISRISRILPTNQMKWLAMSGLSHLEVIQRSEPGVHILREQRRMHEDVCNIVSAYQYDNFLVTAPEVRQRTDCLPRMLSAQPRAIWYVLDEGGEDLPSIRAERGPGNRSWVRAATRKILHRLFADSEFRAASGLFISPFKAQAKDVAAFLARHEMATWNASTVHSQQGAEADIVLFDTVNAGSHSWSYDEWQRLVNVALSRARQAVILLASRAEMAEPYLRPLLRHLSPQVLKKRGRTLEWEVVPVQSSFTPPGHRVVRETSSMGYQIAKRKELRPVLSQEQERLCGLELDGKPRLVRGVAGSGKTVVLAHWLMQTVKRLQGRPNIRIWVVFANRSLQRLISDSIATAWEQETGGKPFPWSCVSLKHIREILDVVLPEVGLRCESFGFEYDQAAAAYLQRIDAEQIEPRCDALFIDEAQDLGPHALKLLTAIVQRAEEADGNSRSVNIFYDNAQNIYGRGTPTWSELGLDMRGRSTVMKESFRSTKPITELALNVLYRFQPPENNPDHRELVARGLIERTERTGGPWWSVRFNQVDGPKPTFRQYARRDQEFEAIADYCRELIEVQGVEPSDICLIYNGQEIKHRLETQVAPRLARLRVELTVQTNKPFERSSHTLLATTSHSFKGYDSEVVIIPAVDQYTAVRTGVLANNLYVAMTRARSLLTIFGQKAHHRPASQLCGVIQECLDDLHERPEVAAEISPQDDLDDILDILGHEHRKWLDTLVNRWQLSQEPILTHSGEIIAEPLFWFKTADATYACFGHDRPRQRVLERLEDLGIRVLEVGQEPQGNDL